MSTTTQPIPETTPPTATPEPAPEQAPTAADRAAARFRRFKRQFGLYTDAELAQRAEKSPTAGFLVDGMIAPGSVNILVGDSGIGKSALVYQLALAVATGRPFLGQRTREGKVVLVDYENSLWDSHRILSQQRKHLGLKYAPYTLMVKPMNEPAPSATRPELSEQYLHENVEELIDQLAAELVIFDSLRSFNPAMETDNGTAADQLVQLRTIARGRGTAILLVHHVRKLGVRQTHQMHLEDNAPLDWLMRSAGARALINQTDARFAISTRKGSDDTLVLRGHLRTHGEIGPYLLARLWDEAGQPLAYRRFDATPDMLGNPSRKRPSRDCRSRFRSAKRASATAARTTRPSAS